MIRLWNIDGEDPHVPEASELDALLKDVGYQKVTLDGNKVTLAKDTPWIWVQLVRESAVM